MSSDDEDLKRAMAMSMQESRPREVINLDSDDEESVSTKTMTKEEGPAPLTLGILGLDRKQMEQERLARKRKVSISPPPAKRLQKTAANTSSNSSEQDRQPKFSSTPSIKPKATPQAMYLQGTVKKTWALGHPRTSADIKLEEVLQKNDLNLAVLSSFQWDVQWLLAKINTKKTLVTFVMQAKDEATKQDHRRGAADLPNLRVSFPPMDGQVNCMHSKLMLLSYPNHLRIVVPTANLVPYDWGESGDMENMVFIIDLPRLPEKHGIGTDTETPFQRELIYFLKAMGLERSIIDSVSNFSFAATKGFAFVHTIGGAHTGDSWQRTGYCGLGRVVKELGLATDSALDVDFVTSSVGSLNLDFLTTLYIAARGDDGTTEHGWRNPETGRGKAKQSKSELAQAHAAKLQIYEEIHKRFHIYFPTRDTVKASKAGYAGTICFQSKWYDSPTFPRQLLRDCKSARSGLLMHNKILYVRPTASGTSWAYVGSANCSESAWGKLSKERTTKMPKLNCRNWECGVIVPVHRDGKEASQGGLSDFEGMVPVPMQYPGDAYGDKRPWFYTEE